MSYLGLLIDFLLSPLGIIGAVFALIAWYQAKQNDVYKWLLVSILLFAASLGKYRDEWVLEPPPLVFPLQQIRNFGRPLAIALLGMVFLVALTDKTKKKLGKLTLEMKVLIYIQILAMIKGLIYGNIIAAFIVFLLFLITLLMVIVGPGRWIKKKEGLFPVFQCFGVAGLIFIVLNLFQIAINTYPVTFTQGRFLGTTGNPQHAGTLLAINTPIFVLLAIQQQGWKKIIWFIAALINAYLLFWTFSRTGIAMGVLSVMIGIRSVVLDNLKLLILSGLAMAIFLSITGIFSVSNNVLVPEKNIRLNIKTKSEISLNRGNTRTGLWMSQWRYFNRYFLFGGPLKGDRMRYGESSWFSVAANFGIVGLIPMIFFGIALTGKIVRLLLIKTHKKEIRLYSDFTAGALLTLLVGSVGEAYLLGTITYPMLVFLIYLLIAVQIFNWVKKEKEIE